MAISTYEVVLEQAQRLSPEDRQRLREALAETTETQAVSGVVSQDDFERLIDDFGLLSPVPTLSDDAISRESIYEYPMLSTEAKIVLALPTPLSSPLSQEERDKLDAWIATARAFSDKLSEAWIDDMSAVEAIRDVRREV